MVKLARTREREAIKIHKETINASEMHELQLSQDSIGRLNMDKSGVTELGASMDIVADTENVMKGMQPKSTFSVDPASMKSEPSHFIMVEAVQNPNTVNNSFAHTKEREAHHPRNSSAITGEYTHIETEMDGMLRINVDRDMKSHDVGNDLSLKVPTDFMSMGDSERADHPDPKATASSFLPEIKQRNESAGFAPDSSAGIGIESQDSIIVVDHAEDIAHIEDQLNNDDEAFDEQHQEASPFVEPSNYVEMLIDNAKEEMTSSPELARSAQEESKTIAPQQSTRTIA